MRMYMRLRCSCGEHVRLLRVHGCRYGMGVLKCGGRGVTQYRWAVRQRRHATDALQLPLQYMVVGAASIPTHHADW